MITHLAIISRFRGLFNIMGVTRTGALSLIVQTRKICQKGAFSPAKMAGFYVAELLTKRRNPFDNLLLVKDAFLTVFGAFACCEPRKQDRPAQWRGDVSQTGKLFTFAITR